MYANFSKESEATAPFDKSGSSLSKLPALSSHPGEIESVAIIKHDKSGYKSVIESAAMIKHDKVGISL